MSDEAAAIIAVTVTLAVFGAIFIALLWFMTTPIGAAIAVATMVTGFVIAYLKRRKAK